MDGFDRRQRLVDDNARYTRSFVKIADQRIVAQVDGPLDDGALWLIRCSSSMPDSQQQLFPYELKRREARTYIARRACH